MIASRVEPSHYTDAGGGQCSFTMPRLSASRSAALIQMPKREKSLREHSEETSHTTLTVTRPAMSLPTGTTGRLSSSWLEETLVEIISEPDPLLMNVCVYTCV